MLISIYKGHLEPRQKEKQLKREISTRIKRKNTICYTVERIRKNKIYEYLNLINITSPNEILYFSKIVEVESSLVTNAPIEFSE